MKITRRFFALLIVLVAPLILFSSPRMPERPATTGQYIAYVGTYTTKTASKGIYAFRYDANSGKLTPLGVAAETQDPSWVAIHPSGKFLYAANEAGKNSMVSAFAVDAHTGKLKLLNQLPALGEDPCYISFDKTGKYVLVANYTSGNVVVLPIGADGKLGAATANVKDQGTLGPNKERQEGAHAHWVKDLGGEVFVADLGLDRVLAYRFDPSKGSLGPMPEPGPKNIRPQLPVALDPGTGPRHVAISNKPNRNFISFMYVLGELDSTVTAFGTTKEGDFQGSWQKIPMLPANFSGRNDAAEIEIHPSGKFLYASNRGHDSIVVYSIDPDWGKLKLVADVPTEGKEPRHFAIEPSGNFLLAEDQLSDKIVTFRIDQKTGALTPTGDTVEVPSPVCLTFLAVE
jgi:6-phosphogluconolactonase